MKNILCEALHKIALNNEIHNKHSLFLFNIDD